MLTKCNLSNTCNIPKCLVSRTGLLYRICLVLNKATMILFYNAHILPLIDYCINMGTFS